MKTDWKLIRKTMNAVIDACEVVESLDVSVAEKCDPEARWGDFENGVSVGDFLDRFWRYPEGAQRDIIRLRSRLDIEDQKQYSEFARALINTAAACAEAVGVSEADLDRRDDGFIPHCSSAGTSIRSQLEKIEWIYQNWMTPEVTAAIKKYRETHRIQ